MPLLQIAKKLKLCHAAVYGKCHWPQNYTGKNYALTDSSKGHWCHEAGSGPKLCRHHQMVRQLAQPQETPSNFWWYPRVPQAPLEKGWVKELYHAKCAIVIGGHIHRGGVPKGYGYLKGVLPIVA